MNTFLGIIAGIFVLVIFFGALAGICGPVGQYTPMSFDEEVKWLMKQGLSREEAEEIANLP